MTPVWQRRRIQGREKGIRQTLSQRNEYPWKAAATWDTEFKT